MSYPKFNVSISNAVVSDKNIADYKTIWKQMQPVTVTLHQLKESIKQKHPFTCCYPKSSWKDQQLFCIDIDHFNPRAGYTFEQFLAVLDALRLPPCMVYTTFSNPPRKKERFRLLFQLDEPVTNPEEAKKVIRFLYGTIEELVPGSADRHCLSPYHLYYPGKQIVLYRPKLSARRDILSETIQVLEQPKLIIKTAQVWNQMRDKLSQNPYIPSVLFKKPPAVLLLILGSGNPWILEPQLVISTSLDTQNLVLFTTQRICYNLITYKKILDIYYYIQGAAEQSEQQERTVSITVFEHYEPQLSELLLDCTELQYCNKITVKNWFQQYKNIVYQNMGIQILPNTPMALPVRYARYAKAVQDLFAYPNLFRLFQRDIRKSQVLASIILIVRDIAVMLKHSPRKPEQYIITHQMIKDRLQKKFKQTIAQEGLTEWLRQFDALHLIHLCTEAEIVQAIKKTQNKHRGIPTVIQIPYFDKNTLVHAEYMAARYKPPVKKTVAGDENYDTVKIILSALLDSYGWFSRDSFIQCIRQENEANNTDGFTVENAKTYFDKYIRQLQQELHLTKSSCTKELMARFPGNHKVGLTKLYYKEETT